MVERLWAGWRIPAAEAGAALDVPEGKTLFETLLDSGLPDSQTCIVWRGALCFAVLNVYPYARGHLMVVPNRPVTALDDLTEDEHSELWGAVRSATLAVTGAYQPHGINVGANLGRGSGAGVPDHLHVHVVPRFRGDTNFMTSVANVRVMPEALSDTWSQIVAAWPADGP
ncbi:MAG: HIT domain-containing protein [Acidimicrobiaceae bacterium]|nr:HIT domain-containing protein [Acidimicrobiaceae bacterium]